MTPPKYASCYLAFCGLLYIELCWDDVLLLLAFFLIEKINMFCMSHKMGGGPAVENFLAFFWLEKHNFVLVLIFLFQGKCSDLLRFHFQNPTALHSQTKNLKLTNLYDFKLVKFEICSQFSW